MSDDKKTPNPESKAAPPAAATKYPARARVRTVSGGSMRHLFTNEELSGVEKKIDIDHFAISQIEAGKWAIVND